MPPHHAPRHHSRFWSRQVQTPPGANTPKTRPYNEEVSTTLIKRASCLSSTDVGLHSPPHLEHSRPRESHRPSGLALIPKCNSPDLLACKDIVRFAAGSMPGHGQCCPVTLPVTTHGFGLGRCKHPQVQTPPKRVLTMRKYPPRL
ncbi:hypothetical protein VNO80_10215 [Phaseolus coccineus]|uniref:Uncharacterized protein n=1 Tax=Phaseolus coccineus TaxID=3886 RepID=A0AAN9N898_PHACN